MATAWGASFIRQRNNVRGSYTVPLFDRFPGQTRAQSVPQQSVTQFLCQRCLIFSPPKSPVRRQKSAAANFRRSIRARERISGVGRQTGQGKKGTKLARRRIVKRAVEDPPGRWSLQMVEFCLRDKDLNELTT